MRNAFAAEITALAGEDERVVLLSGDIGNRLFNDFKAQFPARFFNCGVAEANMTGVAAGMALCGLRPVTYTIAPFVTTRCLEQIRVDICYHHQPVIIVGVGGGLSYASLGATHHSCEDIGFLRLLPHMKVICPGDSWEVRLAIRAALEQNDPVYIRLGKKGEPAVHGDAPAFQIGKGIVLREGTDVCLLTTGNMLPNSLAAADKLDAHGVSAQVVSMHTVKPLDEVILLEIFAQFSLVVSLEEHSVLGGLGGSIAEWLAAHPTQKAQLMRIGTADTFLHEAGDQGHARQVFGLTHAAIAKNILSRLQPQTSRRSTP